MEIQKTQIYINGMLGDFHTSYKQKDFIENLRKSKVELNFNSSEGLSKDLFNSTFGLISSHIGYYLESSAADSLLHKILTSLNKSKKLVIYAHSQGSVILRNVLDRLKLFPPLWKKLINKLEVVALGAANYIWPKKLKVISYVNSTDILSRTMYEVNYWLYKNTNLKNGNKISKAQIINTDDLDPFRAHSLESILKS